LSNPSLRLAFADDTAVVVGVPSFCYAEY